MARRRMSSTRELPPPLPPEQRTIGQLVAEAIRLYGATFLRALPLGGIVAVANLLAVGQPRGVATVVLAAAAPVFTLGYGYATHLATGVRPPLRAWLVALAVGVVVWLVAAALFPWFSLAAVLWLALVGLAVPVALVERTSFAGSLRRGFDLGRADYLHAAGSLATLVVLFVLTRTGLALLLASQADNTVRTAIFLADLVVAPMLFLGGALLYVDQEARLRSRGGAQDRNLLAEIPIAREQIGDRREERDADLPDADHADREGRPDAAREPRPSQ
jgi:hypothetical protein